MTSDIMNYYLLLKIPKCASSSFCFPFQEVLNKFMAVLIIVEMSDWQDCGEVAALSELSAVSLVAGIKWRELDTASHNRYNKMILQAYLLPSQNSKLPK